MRDKDEIELNSNRHFDQVYKDIVKVKNTKFNFIPFGKGINRFRDDFPGVIKKNYTIVTAASGIGKSKFTNFYYILQPLEFAINHPDEINLKIQVFPLEEGKTKFYHSIICNLLKERYGLEVSTRNLKGIPDTDRLTDELLDKIKALRPYFDVFEKIVQIEEGLSAPKAMYNSTRKLALTMGKMKETYNESGDKKIIYVPNSDKNHIIRMTDHIGLLDYEAHVNIKEAIYVHSSVHSLRFRDMYNMSVVDVQQQDANTEAIQFTSAGKVVARKFEPSKAGLAENKQTFNNADEVLGLFAANRYELEEHAGHPINLLGDRYRQIKFLKHRDGAEGTYVGLDFDGSASSFKELPNPKKMKYEDWVEYVGLNEEDLYSSFGD